MPTMSEAAAYEFLRRALFIGCETLANFHETEAADDILFYAIEKGESSNANVGIEREIVETLGGAS